MTPHHSSGSSSDLTRRRRENLRRLLSPRHLAFVGGRNLVEPLRQAKAFGFSGPIWAVNPSLESIEGVPCVRSVRALPEPPDATFLAVPREASIAVARDLADMNAGGVIGYAAGFAELGGDGVELQRRLVEAAGERVATMLKRVQQVRAALAKGGQNGFPPALLLSFVPEIPSSVSTLS